jgi:hypothetical protein
VNPNKKNVIFFPPAITLPVGLSYIFAVSDPTERVVYPIMITRNPDRLLSANAFFKLLALVKKRRMRKVLQALGKFRNAWELDTRR